MRCRFQQIAVVGAGLVGAGWAIVFARAGKSVTIFDEREAVRDTVLHSISDSLKQMHRHGLIEDVNKVMGLIRVASSLAEGVAEADYIQESVFERTEVKRAISHAISAVMQPTAIVGSSSSGIPASAFTQDVSFRDRFIIAHPVNPPHLIPLVELVPSPWTAVEIPLQLRDLMEEVGQKPIVVNREIEGFVLNRLQGALLNEAWALFEAGIATAADIDRTVSEGLGLRWSFMGPFETIDLNAPGGVADYAERLGPLYHSIASDRRDPKPWSIELIQRVSEERRAELALADLQPKCEWRDKRLMALAAHQAAENKKER